MHGAILASLHGAVSSHRKKSSAALTPLTRARVSFGPSRPPSTRESICRATWRAATSSVRLGGGRRSTTRSSYSRWRTPTL
eukprot:4669005-Pleurochrysis_carterae.AAC.2